MSAPPIARKANLTSVLVRIERAKTHLAEFDGRAKTLVAACHATVVRELDEQRSEYVFRLGQIPDIPPVMSAIIGDAIHNLRVSLDYLMWQLVIASGQTPNDNTAFPILMVSPTPNRHGQVRVNVNPCVPEAMQRELHELQPYKRARPLNHDLAVLHRLDINDKHHELLFAIFDVRNIGWFGDAELRVVKFGPYHSGSEICRFRYLNAPGPVSFTVMPMFELCLREQAAGAWGKTISAADLVRRLISYVEDEVIPRFQKNYF